MFNQFPQYPQMPQINQYSQPMRQYGTTRQEVTRVNGAGGANAYQMMPNSSALLLDETAPIVWLVTTDGAGFKSVQPYEIKPYTPQTPMDPNDLEARIKRLEEIVNAKSDHATVDQTTAAYQHNTTVPAIQTADVGQGSTDNGYGPSQQQKNDTATV